MKENVLKVIALLLLLIINDIGVIGALEYVSSPETGASVSSRPEGALVGGTFDFIADELINAEIDSSDKKAANRADGQHQMKGQCPSERRERNNKRDRREHFTLSEIKELTAEDLSEDVIMSQIRSTKSRYTLSTADIISLKEAKVADGVIEYMIRTTD